MSDKKKPNFLIIVADDLGFSDIGAFGGEISTPNLDRLAKEGARLTDFHTASACSPTRSMLLSGTDNHLAGLGQMAETKERNSAFKGKPGYEGVLNDRVAPLPAILKDLAGYSTHMSGKWHLGLTPDAWPSARGFDTVFSLLPGAGNHYAYEPAHVAGEATPLKFMPSLYVENDRPLPIDQLPENFYSTETFTSKLLEQLSSRTEAQPFFAYLAYTAPHWPLQAPKEYIERYKGKYDEGPYALRDSRLEKLKELGLAPKDVRPHPQVNIVAGNPWRSLTEEERRISSKGMEIYAAMVEFMDEQIGRVFKYLEETVFFSSDNGAEGALLEAIPVMGDQLSKVIARHYDNSIDNIGEGNSFIWYGPEWAQAATAPSAMFKAWITEGGIRCPAIVKYPSFHTDRQAGVIADTFTTVMDILPTVLDLAGTQHPAPEFQGRKVLTPRGKSWVPYFANQSERVHAEDHVHGWELFGQQAIRRGHWKALFLPPPSGTDKWTLFNLASDPGETEDLAEKEPEILKQMIAHWVEYEAETGTILLRPEEWQPGYLPQAWE
ncbi:arylsulfatase [Phaffia rhodozyma]|uniref:Arylsulfatase n=1 Tax=Phaffia rhodozyma TaxID=264483 RepID=A0A0F7SV93_PHARH|nr:arylsulfatase [Phaffia rhodozyma]